MAKQPKKIYNIDSANINVDIDYDKLAEAITKAQKNADLYQKQQDTKEIEMMDKEWRKLISEREYDYKKSILYNFLMFQISNLKILWNIIFIKEKTVRNARMLSKLIGVTNEFMFRTIETVFGVGSLALLMHPFRIKGNIAEYLVFGLFAFILFVISRVVKIARLETRYIEDSKQILVVFSTVVAFVSLVMAAIGAVFAMAAYFKG